MKLHNLPETLDPDSLRVSAGPEFTLLDVAHSELEEEDDSTLELKQTIKDIESKKMEKDLTLHKIETLRNFGLKIPSSQSTAPIEDLDRYLEILSAKGLAYHEQTQKQDLEIEHLESYKRELEKTHGINGTKKNRFCTVSFKALAKVDKPVFNVTYVLFNAAFTTLYRVKADEGASLEVDYIAKVYNNTGENWENTPLVLSTSTPSIRAEIPDLTPSKAQIKPRFNVKAKAMTESAPMMLRAMPCVEMAAVQNNTISSTFTINGLSSIPSDETLHKKVNIAKCNLQANMRWVFVPSVSDRAYLQSEVTNSTNMPLLGGEALIFMDGEFVSHSAVPETLPGSKFELSLGVDKNMKITTKSQVDRYNGVINKGLLDRFNTDMRMQSRSKSAVFEVHNMRQELKGPPADVMVKAQVPVSVDERVRVIINKPKELMGDSNTKLSNTVEWVDKHEGLFTWRFGVENTRLHDVRLDYEIQWPENELLDLGA